MKYVETGYSDEDLLLLSQIAYLDIDGMSRERGGAELTVGDIRDIFHLRK